MPGTSTVRRFRDAGRVVGPRALVAGMVRLFESIGVTVVGEGIANAEQYVHMTSLRCQIGQGYYIAMPGPADEIEQWLSRSRARENRRAD